MIMKNIIYKNSITPFIVMILYIIVSTIFMAEVKELLSYLSLSLFYIITPIIFLILPVILSTILILFIITGIKEE